MAKRTKRSIESPAVKRTNRAKNIQYAILNQWNHEVPPFKVAGKSKQAEAKANEELGPIQDTQEDTSFSKTPMQVNNPPSDLDLKLEAHIREIYRLSTEISNVAKYVASQSKTNSEFLQRILADSAKLLQYATPSPKPTFTPFNKLPLELRLKIWKLLLPGPRIIELFMQPDLEILIPPNPYGDDADKDSTPVTPDEGWRIRNTELWKLKCNQEFTPLLHVCREWRTEMLKKMSLRLDTPSRVSNGIHINPQADTIFFPRSQSLCQLDLIRGIRLRKNSHDKVEHIAIDATLWRVVVLGYRNTGINLFENWTALKTLSFIVHGEVCRRGGFNEVPAKDMKFVRGPGTEVLIKDTRLAGDMNELRRLFEEWKKEGKPPVVRARVLEIRGKRCCLTENELELF